LLKRALSIQEKALGPDHLDVAATLNALGVVYYQLHRFAEAEPLLKRAQAIREKALGPDDLLVAASLNDLANVCEGQGRYASRTRSPITSRSNWAKESSTFKVSRPMLEVVLKDWVTETNETACASKSSTSLAKSAS
jgi:tetratricopeptide (TPR) repeat protein